MAPGKIPFGILIPPTIGANEVFWNGQQLGGVGSLPPQARWYFVGKEAVFSLGNETGTHGVLCLRLWAPPAATTSDPSAGGFRRAPQIGSLSLLRQQLQFVAYRWEHRLLPSNIAGILMCAAGLLSLLFFLRGSRQAVYLGLCLLLLGNAFLALQGYVDTTLYFGQ